MKADKNALYFTFRISVAIQPSNAGLGFVIFVYSRWVEQDPKEILQSVYECMERTCEKLNQLNINIANIKGITIFKMKKIIIMGDFS